MINQTRPTSIRFILAAALLASSLAGPAFAGDAVHAASGESVGHAIAEQGNEALRQIREDMRRSLDEALRPQPTMTPRHGAQSLSAPVRTRKQITT